MAFLGRYKEAQEVANELLRNDSTNIEAIYIRGLCLYYEDNIDKAFSHFQQVLKLAPDHSKAKEAFKRARQLKTKKDEGNEAFKANRYEEATRLYSEALLVDPENKISNAKLYFNRATVGAKVCNDKFDEVTVLFVDWRNWGRGALNDSTWTQSCPFLTSTYLYVPLRRHFYPERGQK